MTHISTTVQDAPAAIHHLRPRGRDIIHVVVGGHLGPDAQGNDLGVWVPTQDEMDRITALWSSMVVKGTRVVVTPFLQEAEVEADG